MLSKEDLADMQQGFDQLKKNNSGRVKEISYLRALVRDLAWELEYYVAEYGYRNEQAEKLIDRANKS